MSDLARVKQLVSAVAAVAAVMVPAVPAAAHGATGSDATNYRITILDPGLAGLHWTVYGDALVELRNDSGHDVRVPGYEGEPYLWLRADGEVFENRASPAVYLNRDRYAAVEVPADASATADPRWARIGGGGRATWHDHRVHWMSPVPPAAVDADRGAEHLIWTWELELEVDSSSEPRPVRVVGELRWIPDVAWWPPVVWLGALGAVAAALVVSVSPKRLPLRWPARAVAVWLGAVAVANLARTVDDVTAVPAGAGDQAVAVTVGAVALAAIGATAWRGRRGDLYGAMCLMGSAVLTMLLFGAGSTVQLSAPILVTSLPEWLRRWTVAASLVSVVPATVVLVAAAHDRARRAPRSRAATAAG